MPLLCISLKILSLPFPSLLRFLTVPCTCLLCRCAHSYSRLSDGDVMQWNAIIMNFWEHSSYFRARDTAITKCSSGSAKHCPSEIKHGWMLYSSPNTVIGDKNLHGNFVQLGCVLQWDGLSTSRNTFTAREGFTSRNWECA